MAVAVFDLESAAERAKARLLAAGVRPERVVVSRAGVCVVTVTAHSASDVRHIEALMRLEGGRVVGTP